MKNKIKTTTIVCIVSLSQFGHSAVGLLCAYALFVCYFGYMHLLNDVICG